MLENQTPELFQDVNKPKYHGTLNLDRWAALALSFTCVCLYWSLLGPRSGEAFSGLP